jgi:hypothetical protein
MKTFQSPSLIAPGTRRFDYAGDIASWQHAAKTSIAVVAVARELAGFIWDIGRLAMSLAVPYAAQAA